MLRKTIVVVIMFFATLFVFSFALAQERAEGVYDELYDMERFEATDTNNDGVLDKEELRAEQKDFEYYRDNARFQHTDTNNDGVLSLEETKAQKRWEKEHHERLAKEAFKDLKNKYPNADFKDINWLKEHPDVAKELYNNRQWLEEHPNVAGKLADNKEWLSKHPEVSKEIYQNRRFLTRNPDIAEKLYDNKEFLAKHPELSKRAYKHREWLNKHRSAVKEGISEKKVSPAKAKGLYKGERGAGKVKSRGIQRSAPKLKRR